MPSGRSMLPGHEGAVVTMVGRVTVVTAWPHEFMNRTPIFFKRAPRSGT